jgi:hypothetical protein
VGLALALGVWALARQPARTRPVPAGQDPAPAPVEP